MKITIQNSRIKRLICWLWYGHLWENTGCSKPEPFAVNRCLICNTDKLVD